MVRVLVPGALAIQEPIQVHMLEGGAELGPLSDGDSVLGATLAFPVLGRLSAVVLLPVERWTIIASVFRTVVPLGGTLGGVVLGLVPMVGPVGIFHVGVFVDHRHHVGNSLRVGLEHCPA